MWEKSENLFKNWLDVCGWFVYNSRHTDTVQPERLSGSERASEARPGEAVFKFTDFLRRWSGVEKLATGYNLPGGAPERKKRGKEKVVTRAVACAEMKFCGTSERGYTVLMNLKNGSLVQQFLKYILWRVWFWLRTNAGGVDKTCKSYGVTSVTEWRTGE